MFPRKTFGKKAPSAPQPPVGGGGDFPRPYVEDDGKMRVIPKSVFDGPQGEFLRALGRTPDDPENIIPQAEDFDRMMRESLERQEARRVRLETELKDRHGHNNLRPFFICGEGVINTPLGNWLIRAMKLFPYDEWNTVYLPMDRMTQAAMGRLPLHPQQSIGPIDELVHERLSKVMANTEQARVDVRNRMGDSYDPDLAERFLGFVDSQRQAIIDYVEDLKPKVCELILDIQRNG